MGGVPQGGYDDDDAARLVEEIADVVLICGTDNFKDALFRLSKFRPSLRSKCFLSVLRRFRDNYRSRESERRRHLYKLGRATMHYFEGSDLDHYAVTVIASNVFEFGPLHAVFSLQYFFVHPHTLLDFVLGDVHDGNMLESVAKRFAVHEIAEVMTTAAVYSRDFPGLVAKLREYRIFGPDYDPAEEKWTDKRVWNFLTHLNSVTRVEFPPESAPLRARVAALEMLGHFSHGWVEASDVYDVVSSACSGDNATMEGIRLLVSGKSAPLGEYFAIRRGEGVLSSPSADGSRPSCINNAVLHRYANGEGRNLVTANDISVFLRSLEESRFFAIIYELKPASAAIGKMGFLTFRFRNRVFHFSTALSQSVAAGIAGILANGTREKTLLVFNGASVLAFLLKEFGWAPPHVIDTAELARAQGRRSLSDITNVVTGGDFCWRASIFGGSTPSRVALEHREMAATVVYHFGIEASGSRDFAAQWARQWDRTHPADPGAHDPYRRTRPTRGEDRARDRASGASSRPRSRSRNRSRPRPRSRSHSRRR